MKTIKLEILAKDFSETKYDNATDCVITRALKRAGYPDYEDVGLHIRDKKNSIYVVDVNNPTYDKLRHKVVRMYWGAERRNLGMALKPKNFEHTIKL